MEKAGREFLLLYLAASRERLLDTVNGLNKEQARFRPSRDRWSVADCVEHVAIVEKAVLNKIQAIVLSPPQPEPAAGTPDDAILSSVPNRSPHCTSPVEALPRRRWTDLGALLRQFEAARERSLRFAAVTQSDLRAYFFLHPQYGELDCYQWLLYLGAHSERHARQADDVLADPGFPRVADSAAV
ncbi:MAG TPA: DinB family protein [Bryobacteraceae bacterium]|nr:DinB family protein [Bryobacteraceae bacterium]